MTKEYWVVQDFHSDGRVGRERRCSNCTKAIATIRILSAANTEPGLLLKVRVPPDASEEDRRRIHEIGVEVI
jgi:hypothetical protein